MVARWLPVERVRNLSYEALQADYLRRDVPVILTDLASDWPALRKWTPEFFAERYGDHQVPVYDVRFQEAGTSYLRASGGLPFGEYLRLIQTGPTDLRLFLFELFKLDASLKADIVLPEWVDALSRRYLVSFFGGEGGVTTFHYDVDLPHVFHALIYGKKDFYLFAPSETPKLYRHPCTVRSYLDVLTPDYEVYPLFQDAVGRHCTLNAGETLVIPSRQWHQVRYPGPSFGVAFRKYELRNLPGALYNLGVQEPIDRLLAQLFPERWFRFKEARSRALAVSQTPEQTRPPECPARQNVA